MAKPSLAKIEADLADKMPPIVIPGDEDSDPVDEGQELALEAPETPPQAAPAPQPEPQPAPTPQAAPEAPQPQTPPIQAAEDWEEFEIDDPQVGKLTLKAKKEQLLAAKNGYLRRDAMDRKLGKYSRYLSILDPIVDRGGMDDYIRLIQLAEVYPQYQRAAYEAAQRVLNGQPLTWADQQAIAATQQAAPTAELDPFVEPAVKKYVEPLTAKVNELTGYFQQQQQTQQRQAQYNQLLSTVGERVKAELRTYWPAEFTGAVEDETKIAQISDYAQKNGYFTYYDVRNNPMATPVAFRAAKAQMDLEARTTTAASPGVAALEAQAVQQAQRAAANAVANGAGGGNPNSPAPPNPKDALKSISSFKKTKDGQTRMKTPREMAEEVDKALKSLSQKGA